MRTPSSRTSRAIAGVALLAVYVGGTQGLYTREGVGVFVVLATAFGLGLIIGRWWALALVFLPAVLAAIIGDGSAEGSAFSLWFVVILLVVVPVTAAGVGLRLAAGSYVNRQSRPPLRRA
jgi:hypothetical protein